MKGYSNVGKDKEETKAIKKGQQEIKITEGRRIVYGAQ